jgi:hypothetical protein
MNLPEFLFDGYLIGGPGSGVPPAEKPGFPGVSAVSLN